MIEISATSEINEREFVEIKQGKYGIRLEVVRENNIVSIPVSIETLESIRECINQFAWILDDNLRNQR